MTNCNACGSELNTRIWVVGYHVDYSTGGSYDWLHHDHWVGNVRRGALLFTKNTALAIAGADADLHSGHIYSFICQVDAPTSDLIKVPPRRKRREFPASTPGWLVRLHHPRP